MNFQNCYNGYIGESYAEKTKGLPPYYLVKKATVYFPEREHLRALDLGAGSLRHSIFLAQNGIQTFAIDKVEGVYKYHAELDDTKSLISVAQEDICKFINEPHEQFDIVLAIHVLPFLPKKCYENFFQELPNLLTKGAVLALTFWGPRDDFSCKGVATMSKDELIEKLSMLELLFVKESESDGSTVTGWQKHWHVIDILACKP